MIEYTSQFRVPYGDVDRMGFFYHAHYLDLFDIGRTELMRHIGLTTLMIEEMGCQMPVCNTEIKYMRPALYDDLLEIKTQVRELPGVTITFHYEVYRHVTSESPEIEKTPITKGLVKLAFMNPETKRAIRPPKYIMDALSRAF